MDSIFLSSLDIHVSALIMIGFLIRLLFARIVETSSLRRNFTKMGLGLGLVGSNFPSRYSSLIEAFWIEESMSFNTGSKLVRSLLGLSDLGVWGEIQ